MGFKYPGYRSHWAATDGTTTVWAAAALQVLQVLEYSTVEKVPQALRLPVSGAFKNSSVEARDRGELASSAAIVPGRKDKGEGVYSVRFSMYLPHAIALRASLAPGTLAFNDRVYHLFQHSVRLSHASGLVLYS